MKWGKQTLPVWGGRMEVKGSCVKKVDKSGLEAPRGEKRWNVSSLLLLLLFKPFIIVKIHLFDLK